MTCYLFSHEDAAAPPTPAAIAVYFRRRRSSIAEITPDDLLHNERLWAEICGLGIRDEKAEWAAENPDNRGSKLSVDVEAVPAADPRCEACGQSFQPQREWSRYCSPRCKQRAKRTRRTAAEKAA